MNTRDHAQVARLRDTRALRKQERRESWIPKAHPV